MWHINEYPYSTTRDFHHHLTVWQGTPVVFYEKQSSTANVVRYFPDGSSQILLNDEHFERNQLYENTSCYSGQNSKMGILRTDETGENLRVLVSTIGSNGYTGAPRGTYVYNLNAEETSFECLNSAMIFYDAIVENNGEFWVAGNTYSSGADNNIGLHNLTNYKEDGTFNFDEDELPESLRNISLSAIGKFNGQLYLAGYDNSTERYIFAIYAEGSWTTHDIPDEYQQAGNA